MPAEEICGCGVCNKTLYQGDKLADHHVYKLGELSYIELAHLECAERENALRAGSRTEPYWNTTE